MRSLVIGYGNITRSDDAAGVRTAELVANQDLPGVEVRTTQQLHIDLLEDFGFFDRVVFVDVATEGGRVTLEKVNAQTHPDIASSHALGPGTLLGLADSMGYKRPEFFLCRIPGENFEFGDKLSAEVSRRTRSAALLIADLIRTGQA